jgi:hypothetical protein
MNRALIVVHLSIITPILAGILCVTGAMAQQQPAVPAASAESRDDFFVTPSMPYVSRIQRVMKLLATSTPEHRHRVRILFYGQSITFVWTDIVLNDLRARFPNADIVAENRAIGGFASPLLSETAESDLYPFYPDLLFLQDYGALEPAMERIYANIRNRTTAEALVFTHHIDYSSDKDNEKPKDDESAKIRQLADKYGFEVVDVRPSWRKFLELNHLDRRKLLRDAIHLNAQGNDLMTKIVVPHLQYDPKQVPFGQDRVRYYDAGGNRLEGSFDDATGTVLKQPLRMEFAGNRLDVAAMPVAGALGTAQILIDGKKPSTFQGAYAATRTNTVPGANFVALRCMEFGPGVVAEDWALTITKINEPCTDFEYEVKGSVTGPDGRGTSRQKFTSRSGRLMIDPKRFSFAIGHQHSKKPVPIGFKVTWKVYGTFLDQWKPQIVRDKTNEDLYTLAQGLPNGRHVLEIIPNGDGDVPVRYLVVYQPAPPGAPSGAGK